MHHALHVQDAPVSTIHVHPFIAKPDDTSVTSQIEHRTKEEHTAELRLALKSLCISN